LQAMLRRRANPDAGEFDRQPLRTREVVARN